MSTNKQFISLITGSNTGIGKAVAREFIANGYTTYICGRNEAENTKTINEFKIEFPNSDIRTLKLDINSSQSIQEAVDQVTKDHGKLDFLVNNAGVFLSMAPPSQLDMEALRKTFDINFFGTVEVTQRFLPLLHNGTKKTIVNVSSDLGSLSLQPYTDYKFLNLNVLAYNSSKTALNGFTVQLSKELASKGFKINAVNPGFVKTNMNQGGGELEPSVPGLSIYNIATQEHGTGRYLGRDFTSYPW
ncbi:short-chain dehydrogenase/reductase (SDR) family protein [Tieghemostelium lacteum]|uniref:Short-chain dehydrogenase/reductase (SDR) family protein n=1 Tax=Tieghemostelium lacteum TaxID=361077 RepID=A0A151ZF78_TIELA|nr:short-chain dehydrogenase/reductase (SDR) family protein [Tieghemostelium lacteum]|eukprot:KYQ92632.1 short-chain dehydrogenase/reductase (SDR) family protein [Tieghemostelium lacteum]